MAAKTRIKDIAEALDLSPATVSRALTSSGLVAEPTLSTIRNKAKEMNYRPNVQARSLRTRRSMSVLVVVRDIGNPFYLEVFKGVEAVAKANNYTVLMGNTENDPDRENEYIEMLHDGHADGMILMTGRVPESWENSAQKIVVALEMINETALSQVLIDNAVAVDHAINHLVELGHKKIAHIRGPHGEGMSDRRSEGFVKALKRNKIELCSEYMRSGDYHFDSGVTATEGLLDLPVPPTAIFASNDEMAFGALSAAQSRGLKIPTDLSIVGLDDIYLSRAVFPALTTVSQPRNAIGRRAMEVLLSQLDGEEKPTDHLLPTKLVERSTTCPPKNKL